MCAQCMIAAATAISAASGARAYAGARWRDRLGRRGLRRLTIALAAAAVLASGLALGGT